MTLSPRGRRARRGGILLSSIMFIAITSMLIIGMLTMSLSFYARAKTESDYENALALAEAGVNYELRAISSNTSNADQLSGGVGVTYSLGGGSFTVYCANKDGTTPWTTSSTTLYIISKGTANGVSRTVQVSVKGVSGNPVYSVYALTQATMSGNGTINGSVGTDGHIAASGSASINGAVEFDGPSTGWNGSLTTGSPISFKASPIVWPTVSAVALEQFPLGGLTWLASNNDNALSPSISNNALTVSGNGTATLVGKSGGANYYLTSISISGSGTVHFDNTLGPITVWLGPLGGLGQSTFSGGSAEIKSDANREVKIYSALKTTFTISGSAEYDGGLYVYDVYNGLSIGRVTDSGGSDLEGSILANKITVSGGSKVNSTVSYFSGGVSSYFGYDDQWQEINPL